MTEKSVLAARSDAAALRVVVEEDGVSALVRLSDQAVGIVPLEVERPAVGVGSLGEIEGDVLMDAALGDLDLGADASDGELAA